MGSSVTKYSRPQSRPLKIFAVDPMQGRTAGNRVNIEIENERLQPGPVGERIEVIDYDGAHKRYYPPVNLDDPNLLIQAGMDPTESDPRFHQQIGLCGGHADPAELRPCAGTAHQRQPARAPALAPLPPRVLRG
jgi:hypothetical protein